MTKRNHIQDSVIMNALDVAEYSIHKASSRLGVCPATLHRWIKKSENLQRYINERLEFDAVKAREKLEYMLDNVDCLDPKTMGNIISICKILLDKAEANKSEVSVTKTVTIDEDLEKKIKELLGE